MNGRNIPYIFRGRNITLPRGETAIQIALTGDNLSNRITFVLDKFYNGVDLSAYEPQMLLKGTFMNEPQEDTITLTTGLTKAINGTTIEVVWTVGSTQTYQNGTGTAQIRFVSSSAAVWHSNIFNLSVGSSLSVDGSAEEHDPSVIVDHTARILALETEIVDKADKDGDKVLTDNNLTDALKADYDGAVSAKHTHSNKAILDSTTAAFTTALKTNYDDANTKKHTHSNKTILDSTTAAFTTALKTAYDGAVNKKHEHSNKTVLDSTTEPFTTVIKADYDGAVTAKHTHSNKAILDATNAAFTTALKTNYDDANTKKHTHSNKAILDSTTAAFTEAEKAKLAALESSHFKGRFTSEAALLAAHPTSLEGDYAHVDTGVGADTVVYVWDVTDEEWQVSVGESAEMTPAQVKEAYESNPDTNAFTDDEKTKLAGIDEGAEVNTVNSVNSKTGAVVLTSTDVGAIPTTEKNTANGVAGLDASGKISAIILPEGTEKDGEMTTIYNSEGDDDLNVTLHYKYYGTTDPKTISIGGQSLPVIYLRLFIEDSPTFVTTPADIATIRQYPVNSIRAIVSHVPSGGAVEFTSVISNISFFKSLEGEQAIFGIMGNINDIGNGRYTHRQIAFLCDAELTTISDTFVDDQSIEQKLNRVDASSTKQLYGTNESGEQVMYGIDDTPTENSTNPIQSGAVYAALGDIATVLDTINGESLEA